VPTLIILAYSAAVYLFFLAVFGYAAAFFAGRGVPRSIVLWSAPVMTAGHVLFAATATGYILAGIAFEEHDLIQNLGGTYAAYRARVPALIPWPWPRRHPPGS
jgi:protein-S-isoprenylcysteine O-methyltransferase Ste14